jgi:hypothetical protein
MIDCYMAVAEGLEVVSAHDHVPGHPNIRLEVGHTESAEISFGLSPLWKILWKIPGFDVGI